MTLPKTEQEARDAGYTCKIFAEGACYSLELLAKPDADLDDVFLAFDVDAGELLRIMGWLWAIELEQPTSLAVH